MEILINYKSKIPIYEQITSQVKKMVLSGQLKEGDPLPAMRKMAKSLRVSVITVQKAYEELQDEGYIDSVVGRGTFISRPDTDEVKERYIKEIDSKLKEAVLLAKNSDIKLEEIIIRLKKEYNNLD